MKRFTLLLSLFLLIISSFILNSLVANAAVNYSVIPRVIDIDAKPRDIIQRTITINNNANYTSSIFPSVNEISLNDGGDIEEFKGPTMVDRPEAITAWLEVPRKEINIPKGESYELPITIRMHPKAKPGIYHALIGFGSGRNRDEAERLVKEGRAPGVVVTIRVEDESIELMDLKKFTIEKFITSNDNQAVSYTFTNPGDIEVIPQGEIIFYDSNGKEVANIPVNPDNLVLKPGEEIEMTASVPVRGLIGKYKGFLNINYGTNQIASVYDTAFFYVLPWQKILFLFTVIVIIVIVLTIFLHKKFGLNDEEQDDVYHLQFRFKDSTSENKEHDINLKK